MNGKNNFDGVTPERVFILLYRPKGVMLLVAGHISSYEAIIISHNVVVFVPSYGLLSTIWKRHEQNVYP